MKLDDLNDSDLSGDEEQYLNLADAVSQLDSTRRVQAPTRKEVSTTVSEFHLSEGKSKKGDVVNVNELSQVLRGKSASHAQISNKVKRVTSKAKTLPKPLETPVAERLKRVVAYENVKNQLKKWNAVVERNRVADHLSFPLQQGRVSLQSSHQFLSKFKPATPLEIEMAKILGTATQEEEDDKDELKKNLEFPLTLEEMMEKKKELAQIRAKLSYQEARAHRQSKIKSKKYHRILKREKIKNQLKEFEQLQKTNPEAALKKLEELDKSRAEERASLRHKNTGKWARNLAVRAKYNKESRKVLAEQLKFSRDLTAKVKNVASDGEHSGEESAAEGPRDMFTTADNPWALKMSSEVSDFVSTCKKYWEDKNKESQTNSTGEGCHTSPEVAEPGNMPNGLSDSSEPASTPLSANTNTTATEKPNSDGVHLECSLTNKSETKGKKIVKNKAKTLDDGQRKVNKSNGDVFSGKKKSLEKKSHNMDTSNVGKQKSTKNKLERAQKRKEIKRGKIKCATFNGEDKSLRSEIHSTSGLWTVREVKEEEEKSQGKRKRIKDIDELFEDLDEKLTSKASKKLKKLKEVKKKYNQNKRKKAGEKVDGDEDSNDDDEDMAFKNLSSLRPEIDEEMAETTGREPEPAKEAASAQAAALNIETSESTGAPPEIDPNKFVGVKLKKLNTKLPDNLTGDDCDYMDDEDATQRMNIVEAFGDDDVMEEFQEMKKEDEAKTKMEIPGALPGWGSWGGTDIKPDERKTRRNTVTMPKLPPRKDKNKKDIIIREKTNPKLLEHMVKDVPHPFKSVGAFESNLRHPLGREWIPETAHRRLIKKPVQTLMGTIIEPMDENELLRLGKQEKSLYRPKKKHNK